MPTKEVSKGNPPNIEKDIAVTVKKEFGRETPASRNAVKPAKSKDVVNGVARERR